MNTFTIIGIITIAVGNLVGGYFIHIGGKKTTKGIIEESLDKTNSLIEHSTKRIKKAETDFFDILFNTHKPHFDDYWQDFQNFRIMQSIYFESKKGKYILGDSFKKIYLNNDENYEDVLTKKRIELRKSWNKASASLESLQILESRLNNQKIKIQFTKYKNSTVNFAEIFKKRIKDMNHLEEVNSKLAISKVELMDLLKVSSENK